ncbi:MAG: hypothetical protein QW767_03890 [Thermoprotei archaeon]
MSATSRPPELRLRLRKKPDVGQDVARMNSQVAKQLQIKDKLEVVIAGKRKLELSVLPVDEVPSNEVHCNDQTLTKQGISDNTIATVRAASSN